jgi:hypothetical protein
MGKFGERKGRGAIDGAARVIVEVEAWKPKKVVGTLKTDIKGAFSTVNSACLRKKNAKNEA